MKIDFVFSADGPDFNFVKIEDESGQSIGVGDWIRRSDGYDVLRFNLITHADVEARERAAIKWAAKQMVKFMGRDWEPSESVLDAILDDWKRKERGDAT